MCADRSGLVGNDGETHQGLFDLSFFSIIPNITILAPKDFKELEQMLEFAMYFKKPIVIRYPRGGQNYNFTQHDDIILGKSEILENGYDISIIAIGKMVGKAEKVREELEQRNISVEVINVRFLKPLDEKIIESIIKTKNVIVMEDNILKGGLSSSIIELINIHNVKDVKIKCFGYPDEFIQHGSIDELEKHYGLDEESIINCCLNSIEHNILCN